jgi:predicted dehydrogenase
MKLPAPKIIDPASVPVLRWGIIGPGNIAETFVDSSQKHTKQEFHAVGSRTPGRAQAFAEKFKIPKTYDNYQDLVADPDLDAIYIASYPADHHAHSLLALNAGKHILVEKPITYLPEHAKEIFYLAKSKGLLAMEAMWTRYLPQSTILQQLLKEGSLGDSQLFTAAFCTDNRAVDRLWEKGGGGIIFDMGIYPIAMAQQFMGNPIKITAQGKVRSDGMDEESYVVMEYANGSRANITMSGISSLPIEASCSFEKGLVKIAEPFLAPSAIAVRDKEFYYSEDTWKDETGVLGHEGLSYQATAFAKYVGEGLLESPVHSSADVVANIEVAQEICRQIGASVF